jgi:hypothetical protein
LIYTAWVNSGSPVTGEIDESQDQPEGYSLSQNYPNPFNPSTIIRYSVPSAGTRHTLSVQLKVYDLLGNEIATLVNEEKPAGEYEVIFDAGASRRLALTSGVYFYILQTGNFIETKKMLFLK